MRNHYSFESTVIEVIGEFVGTVIARFLTPKFLEIKNKTTPATTTNPKINIGAKPF